MLTSTAPGTAAIPGLHSSTISDAIDRAGSRFTDRVAITFDDRSWTYAQLNAAVTRVAAHLIGRGLTKGSRVAAYGQNSDAFALLFLACARAGLIHVPINYALTGGELSYILDQSDSQAIYVDSHLAKHVDALSDVPAIRASFTEGPDSILAIAQGSDEPAIEVTVEDSDVVQLLYTSGTTSRPKGSIMTHRALMHHYVSSLVALDFTQNDIQLLPMPLYHSAGMHVFLLPYLMVGAKTHLLQVPVVPTILERIERDKITSMFLAPTVWVPLSQHPDFSSRDLSSLVKAQYGASIMPVPVLKRIQATLPEAGFYNCFGQSEIGPLSTVLRPEEHEKRPDACGRPVLFVEMRVVDSEMNDVAVGDSGEVIYRSPQLCLGYWDNPQATEEAFQGGWFHSGDLATIDAEGFITVVDRIKDVINTGGVLVASREVEDRIYEHPAVAEVAVVGIPDEKWIEAVTAYVVRKDDVTEEALIAHCKETLARFKVPKNVRFVEELPRNASGKLLKRVLRDSDKG